MPTIGEIAQRAAEINLRLSADLTDLLRQNATLAADLVREQLEAGQDGSGEPLTPSYLTDPYFQQFHHPEVAARNYMNYKMRITPPQTTWRLMLPPRAPDTPNLRINGYYHAHITATPTAGGLTITAAGDPVADDVTAKYGDKKLYTLTPAAKQFFKDEIIIPYLSCIFKQ